MENKNKTNKKQDIEQVKNEPLTIEEIKNSIPDYIKDFCIQYNIEDLTKESSNRFNALLLYINTNLIKPNKDTLKNKDKTNNKYNTKQLDTLLNIYINLCMLYDNAVTITGFCTFSGIDHQTFYNLQHDTKHTDAYNNITKEVIKADKTSPTGFDIWQKLRTFEEQTTLDCRKYNDLRIIARLNRITGGAYRDYVQTDTGTAERPQLDGEQIAHKYGALQGADSLPQLPEA